MQPTNRSRSGGFTAAELMVSLAVLALAVVPLLTVHQGATGQLHCARGHVLAQARALTLLEGAAARGFDDLAVAAAAGAVVPLAAGAPPAALAVMAERVTFTSLSEDLGRLEAVVEWRGGPRGEPRRARCFRLLGRRDASWRIAVPRLPPPSV